MFWDAYSHLFCKLRVQLQIADSVTALNEDDTVILIANSRFKFQQPISNRFKAKFPQCSGQQPFVEPICQFSCTVCLIVNIRLQSQQLNRNLHNVSNCFNNRHLLCQIGCWQPIAISKVFTMFRVADSHFVMQVAE